MKNYIFILLVAISTVSIAQNSIRLVDLNSNYLSIDNSNGAFFETGDFTFEMWIKIDAWDTGGYAGYKAGILSYNQSNFWLAIQSQGKPQLRMGCGDLTFSYTASDWVGNWKHVALVRVGETLNWYVDGQLSASKSCSGGKFMDTNTINIGTNPGWTCSIDGWISKIRYVKGTAVYTSDFTPVFEDLENISGTELLLNVANETDAFKDSSNANHTINLHGSNANPYFVANNGPLMPADILMSGDVSIENNSIKNVADPVYAQDAATKNYVDSNVNSFSGSYNDLTDTPTSSNAFQLPLVTTDQRDEITPQSGMMVYNIDVHEFQGFQNYEKIHPAEIDQQHVTINNGGGENRAQSFTAGVTGELELVKLPLGVMMEPVELLFKIIEGEGVDGNVLFQTSYNLTTSDQDWIEFSIIGVDVISGNKYTIQLLENSGCGMPPCYNWGMDTSGDNYIGGQFFYNGTPYSNGEYDSAFITYVSLREVVNEWKTLH